MKLLTCNGRELEVRDVGPVVYRLVAGEVPIKLHGRFAMDDDAARDLLRELIEAGARNFRIGAQLVPAVSDAEFVPSMSLSGASNSDHERP
jgi:hypothetical protein